VYQWPNFSSPLEQSSRCPTWPRRLQSRAAWQPRIPHQLIRDYCPAIIELPRRRSDEVYTTSCIADCSYRRLQSYSEAFSRIPTLRCLGDEYELTGAIIGRHLRPISMRYGPWCYAIGWPCILLVWQLTAGWLTANATQSRSITAARPAPNLSSPLPMCYAIWRPHAPVIYIPSIIGMQACRYIY